MTSSWALTDDLSDLAVAATLVLLVLSILFLGVELRRKNTASWWVFVTGVVAGISLALAVFRPVVVSARTSQLGPRVIALVDESRRMLLKEGETTRAEIASRTVEKLREHYQDARLSVFGFSEGKLRPYAEQPRIRASGSDLLEALDELSRAPGERPAQVVVVSDGRLTRPDEVVSEESLRRTLSVLDVPIHTVGVVSSAPSDASIRSIRAAGAAVAHQPLALTIEVGCSADLDCAKVPVTVRELLHGEPPLELASGVANVEASGVAKIELSVTLDRAGSRVLEVRIDAPNGDSIPENNERYVAFSVAKERIRLLHLAGRPTYDVRALRTWLKSDESVDVVAFFILRGDTDDPGATERELALIRFPVDELFTEHLPSFDAIILQDIDAIRYKLSRYLVALEGYVKKGGGLIMVGGPSSFAGGNYAGTPLDSILPVEQPRQEKTFDAGEFVPSFTPAGLAAPVTQKLRSLLGGELPALSGANILGAPRSGAIVLWEHPRLTVGERGMPVLALGEAGDGRAIALGVDSTHRLAFGKLAATVNGRAYGALWDGLLGWLMRDPRYEAARVELVGECVEGQPTRLKIFRLPGMTGDIELRIEPLSPDRGEPIQKSIEDDASSSVEVEVDGLRAGGYAAQVVVGSAPTTRHDFGCEKGGLAWADSRPDSERLALIAEARGGLFTAADNVDALPVGSLTQVTAERHVSPVLPAWAWTLVASLFLGVHWLTRRQSGLA